MKTLFTLSYSVVFALVTLESLLLCHIMKRLVSLRRFGHPQGEKVHLPRLLGKPCPDFSAPIARGSGFLRSRDLIGRKTFLVFASPEVDAEDLTFVANLTWHKADGNVYLLCSGEKSACFTFTARLDTLTSHPISVGWDEHGSIARQFHIEANPEAVELDDDGQIVRYGQLPSSRHAALEMGSLEMDRRNAP